jgi:ABC-type transport system involved in multi-copper enzyme maturation permease subunit
MKTKKEKLLYAVLIVLDVLAILATWNFMKSTLNNSIAIVQENPFSDTAVYSSSIAMLATIFSPIMLILELVVAIHLIGEVMG